MLAGEWGQKKKANVKEKTSVDTGEGQNEECIKIGLHILTCRLNSSIWLSVF